MSTISRRTFNRLVAASGAVAAASLAAPGIVRAAGSRVVVIGGGFGGATAARYLKKFDPSINVTLVEPSTTYLTCPFSNTILGGLHPMSFLQQNFNSHKALGVTMIHDLAVKVDAAKKQVTLASGKTLAFDRCVVSPGIDFKWGAVKGADQAIIEKIPHAWKAGPQTSLLRKQLEAMKDGGTFLISPPPNPFRCPPGPGERISMVAHYLKQHKPKSKIVVLDPKKSFSKQGLFLEGWKKLYPGMIEYRNIDKDGTVREVLADKKTLITDFGEVKGDVINFIPPQKAGAIAHQAGLADASGWCPVDHRTFESTIHESVHVIGDASIASPMPKSGFSASTQAKVCAAAIAEMLRGNAPGTPKFVNTCYSLVGPDYGISVAAVYGFDGQKIVSIKGAGGLSPSGSADDFHQREALYADGWYRSITKDIWG
ncbi:MAG: NAD(P)/FAD-dependent oxidoreductase [Rhodospirillaceae bacterium]